MILRFLSPKALSVVILVLQLLLLISEAKPFSAPPQVKQSSPPRLVQPVGEEDVKLTCNVRDAQNYTWYKNGKAILQQSGRYTVKKNRFLRIKGGVQKSDSGVFVCVTENSYGSANCTTRLIVEDPTVSPTNIAGGEKPQFLYPARMKLIKSTYKEGDKVNLTCEAKGVPAPKVTWHKDGQVFHGRSKANESIASGKYDYIIDFPEVDLGDEGNYTCVVWNIHGQLTYSYNFDVIEKIRSIPLIAFNWEQEEPVYAGSNLELYCVVLTKDPDTKYRWYYRDSDIPESTKLGTLINKSLYKLTPYQNGESWPKWRLELNLKNVSVADSGLYACQAENVVGNGTRDSYLNVTVRPITLNVTVRPITRAITWSATVMSTVSAQKEDKPGKKSATVSETPLFKILIGILVGVIVLAIIAAGVCYWQVKKVRASLLTAKNRRPQIDSLRAKYEVQNEYVVVPDYIRSV